MPYRDRSSPTPSARVLPSLAVSVAVAVPALARAEATWEQQAERLQNVSATLLDAVPFADPVRNDASVELKAPVSFLPDVNPRVGAKKEKVPSAPVHAVPTLQGNARFLRGSSYALGAQAWAGYLPSGGEKLFGIDARLRQWTAGGLVSPQFALGSFDAFLSLGAQYSDADLEGAITEPKAKDSFRSRTVLAFAAPGVVHRDSGLWGNVLVSAKRTKSVFEIPSDGTKFEITDRLSDSTLPVATQVAAGWSHESGLQAAGAMLFVPKRLVMPRLLLSYQYAL